MPGAGQTHTADLTLNVNGQNRSLRVRHHWTLLDVIREQLDLTGSKRGGGGAATGASAGRARCCWAASRCMPAKSWRCRWAVAP